MKYVYNTEYDAGYNNTLPYNYGKCSALAMLLLQYCSKQ